MALAQAQLSNYKAVDARRASITTADSNSPGAVGYPDFIDAEGKAVFVRSVERNAFTKTSMAQSGAGLAK
jgi:hypothetical protein